MLVNKKQAVAIQEKSQQEIKNRLKDFDEGLQERVKELVRKYVREELQSIINNEDKKEISEEKLQ